MTTKPLSEEQRAEVVRLVATQGLVHAVLYVRQVTGAGLAEAIEAVRKAAELAGVTRGLPTNELRAEIIAVGPFAASLASHLEYPAARYSDVPEGTAVVTTPLFAESTEDVYKIAACFGIDPWDFNTHALDVDTLDLAAMTTLFPDEAEELVLKFTALRAAGFRFYFLDPESW